jgi:hypothetical protein
MNRLCQSSYGNLEAVISLTGYGGDPWRKLVHFTRDWMSGQWSPLAAICEYPKSGGSIIQNISRNREHQEHGDFEVIVLEEGGLKHYTRWNTVPPSEENNTWRCVGQITNTKGEYPVGMLASRSY